MDRYMTFEDAENQEKDREMLKLVTTGVINPEPVFDLIGFHKAFGQESEEDVDKLTMNELSAHINIAPAYARRVEEQL